MIINNDYSWIPIKDIWINPIIITPWAQLKWKYWQLTRQEKAVANTHTCAHGTDTKTKCQCDLFQAVWFVHQQESLYNTPMCLEDVVPFLPKSQLLVLIHELIFID